jgi:hypothetical protein
LADEVRRLLPERELLFVKAGAPIVVERLNYLRDGAFEGRGDKNPAYAGVESTSAAVSGVGRGPLASFQRALSRIRPWLPPSSVTSAGGTAESPSAPPPVEASSTGGGASVTVPE